jgi:ABC-type phosphate transport system substrate-binding protein
MKKMIITAVALLLIAGTTTMASAETVMIVNAENPAAKVTASEIANFFLGKTTQWKGGLKAAPVDQKKDTAPGKAFLAKIVKMNESDFKNLWVEKMLSGGAEPPKVLDSDEAVIKFVKENKGAVGYIDAANLKEGVKALEIDGKKQW